MSNEQKTSSTPGPWFVWEPETGTRLEVGSSKAENILVCRSIPGDCNQEIARVNCLSSFFDDETEVVVDSEFVNLTAPSEAVANANLIAVAPSLLGWAKETRLLLEGARALSAGETDEAILEGEFMHAISVLSILLEPIGEDDEQ